MERPAARQPCEWIRRVPREQAVCLIQAARKNTKKRKRHVLRLLQHVEKVLCWNSEAPRALQRHDACRARTITQDAEFSEDFSRSKLTQEHLDGSIRHRFENTNVSGEDCICHPTWIVLPYYDVARRNGLFRGPFRQAQTLLLSERGKQGHQA